MKLGVLFSGGKDSVFAMFKAKEKHEIACLIAINSENRESYMFHTPNISLTIFQAEALGLPLITQKTKGIKELELEDLKKAIKEAKTRYKIEGIVTGALKSEYQASRIKKICDELGLECINPLWNKDQIEYLRELVDSGFKIIITGVFAEPFTEKWLGREINSEMIDELEKLAKKHKINPAGEGGELETFAVDGPIFKKRIEITKFEIKYNNHAGTYDIKNAKLVVR